MGGEVVRPAADAPERGVIGGKALDQHVVEVLGVSDVLQAVRAEVPQGDPLGQGVLHQASGGVRDQDLSAVGGVGDAGRPVHVDADVVASAEDAIAGVEAHSDAQRGAMGPMVGGEPPLSGDRRLDGLHGTPEGREERVSVDPDHRASGVIDRPPHDARLLVLHHLEAVPDLLEQARGALDTGEQEGHRPGRQFCHGGR